MFRRKKKQVSIVGTGAVRVEPNQLFSEDSGAALTYKPNQIIGSLGGRQVRLVNKKTQESTKSKNKAGKKPFEMTNRFTVNLPRGQKAVLRVSPAMILGDLMTSVCRDKDLDPRRHILQLPGKPGMPIDLNATVGQLGAFEINLTSASPVHDQSMTNSMPDLSQVPTYMPGAGEKKKKRGFLSFLSKRDSRKFKPQDTFYTIETSSTASHQMSSNMTRKSSSPPPSAQRRVSDTGLESSRPKSMFVSSSSQFSLPHKENMESHISVGPRKKRKAPAPPAPGGPITSSESVSSSKQDINANENKERLMKSHNGSSDELSVASNQRGNSSSVSKTNSAPSRAEMLSRFHSRNSSDSSGYHELTLSGCDSPEAGHNMASKSKTSIDSTSIESSDINNGADSGIHESPVRVSPIEEVLEKNDNKDHYAIKSTTLPFPSRKKKKAPAPPAPTSVQTPTQQTVAELSTPAETPVPVQYDDDVQYQRVQDQYEAVQLTVSAEVNLTNHETNSEVISPPDSFATQPAPSTLHMNEDPDLSDEDINTAFNIDDILDGVTFDDEPKRLDIKTYAMLNEPPRKDDDGDMMMMETSSIASENIEQGDSPSKSDRPCAFIPPPPPTEPPPPEIESVYMDTSSTQVAPLLIDKETEVNDDNTSLAPGSIKNSPEPERHHKRMDSFSSLGSIDTIEGLNLDFEMAIRMGEETLNLSLDDVEVSQDGYKNEMALFVERMSQMSADNGEGNALNDSLSSGLTMSETNSDTGSVIQHLRTDSSDSKSGLDSGSWSKKDVKKVNGIKELDAVHESSPLKVSEEITVPFETVPPPPEFDDVKEKKVEVVDDEEEEEEYTETIEELIIPLGPNGFDFTAARIVAPKSETPKEIVQISPRESDHTFIKNGVFRAEPVSIKPVSPRMKEVKTETKKVEEKEEFILTTDDLSSVCFLPPRPRLASRKSEKQQKEPKTSVSSAVLIMDKSKAETRGEEDSNNETESIQSRVSQISFTPMSEPETDSVLEVKPISLLNRPSMRPPPTQDTEEDNSVFPPTPSPINVFTNQRDEIVVENASNDSVLISDNEDSEVEEATGERSESRASTNGLDSQYDMLQVQFAQWQEQLATNQTILSQATGNDLQTEQLQQLTTQMTMQQNMMMQIQSTMQALQQQQMVNGSNGNGDKAASVEFPSVGVEQAAAAAEPLPPPPFPPPSIPAASGTKGVEISKSGHAKQAKTKSRQKPKFERELNPREQLMFAIRGFQGREGLKSVAKKDTKWIHSNK